MEQKSSPLSFQRNKDEDWILPEDFKHKVRQTFQVIGLKIANKHVQEIQGKYIYEEENVLGEGSYGKVYLGRDVDDNRKVAIKKTIIPSDKNLQTQIEVLLTTVKNEVFALLTLQGHPNIVNLYDFGYSQSEANTLYLILQYCSQGDLKSFIKEKREKNNGVLEQAQIRFYFTQILEGFKVIRKHSFVHKDMKPQNILVHRGVLKISDFGSADYKKKRTKVKSNLMGNTIVTASPQILFHLDYTDKCDIYSLGCILYWMVYDRFPVEKFDSDEYYNDDREVFPSDSDVSISQGLQDIIRQMLRKEEKDRIDWNRLFEFFDKKDLSPQYLSLFNTIGESTKPGRQIRDTIKEAMIQDKIPDRATFYTTDIIEEEPEEEGFHMNIRNRAKVENVNKQFLRYIFQRIKEYSLDEKVRLEPFKEQITLLMNLLIIGIEKIITAMLRRVKQQLFGQVTAQIFNNDDLREFLKAPNLKYKAQVLQEYRFQESKLKDLTKLIDQCKQKCDNYMILDKVQWLFKNVEIDQNRFERHLREVILQLVLFLKMECFDKIEKEAVQCKDTIVLIHNLFLLYQRREIFCQANFDKIDSNFFLSKEMRRIQNPQQFRGLCVTVKELLSKFR